MYSIRQFKPTLYLLVIMGVAGYAMAAELPEFFIFPTLLILLNAWLVKTGRFAPLPRPITNAGTLLCLVWAISKATGSHTNTILILGQFMIVLQLVKLYEQRANRDYAQLLVLSLLLMVAASINTASLLFGLLLIAYLFLSLYCCLLFHLKVETEHARMAMALPESSRTELTLRQDQRSLTSSMRRLTILVSFASIFSAILVFLFFPRGMGAGLLGPLTLQPSQTLTGFNDQVSFQRIAAITQSNELVAYVQLYRKDQGLEEKPVQGTQTLLLRGITFDIYNGNDQDVGQWQWSRSQMLMQMFDTLTRTSPTSMWRSQTYGPGETVWRQHVVLLPTGTLALFAMAGAYELSSNGELSVRQSQADEILQSGEVPATKIEYTVKSRGYLANRITPTDAKKYFQRLRDLQLQDGATYSPDFGAGGKGSRRRFSQIDPAIAAYALRPDVGGTLAAKRDRTQDVTDDDEEIAKRIEKHLQTQFTYTLDLTDAKRLVGQDPMVWFLSDEGKRGHCEYFAGAMTLMCQSLGMQARLVAGFKCDEYNEMSQMYQVRQSHAHAWVEVLTTHGWTTFDPTSGRPTPPPTAIASAWQKVKHVFNYLEFAWASHVVAYDNDNRENLVANLNQQLTHSAIQGHNAYENFRDWLHLGGEVAISQKLMTAFMALLVLVIAGGFAMFVYEKWRLRRRAARIGLAALPPSDQIRLARQLGFYDDLVLLLERHQIVRPSHLTPQEFSDSLSYLPSETFQTIRRLTSIFYRIRYGRRELSTPRQRLLGNVILRLQHYMQNNANQTAP
ncbi:hypothetical protein BH10PLA1_BH10PLA1_10020 [soil metagenome]